MPTPSAAEHIVGATCPHCQHPNYYDARELCKGVTRYRRRGHPPAQDEVLVACQNPDCKEEFKINVDCEAHR